MKSSFPGLPTEALKFFRALEQNNNRDWFEKNKPAYVEKVRDPMEALATAISAELTRFAPAYATEPKKALFRIYRDTRFSSNKTPYKTNAGALFFDGSLGKTEAAAFYFEVNARYLGVAAGCYMPDAQKLRAMRTHLLENHKRFDKLVNNKSLVEAFGPIQGDKLTRPPKGFPADHPAAEWIKHKQWYFWRELDPKIATSPEVVNAVVSRFKKALPVVDFLNEPLEAARRKLAPLLKDL